jgi:hypothetical protein
MGPKARGLVQHGCPNGWLEESDPAGVILYVMDGPYRQPFPYRTGCLYRSCELMEFPDAVIRIVNVPNHPT